MGSIIIHFVSFELKDALYAKISAKIHRDIYSLRRNPARETTHVFLYTPEA